MQHFGDRNKRAPICNFMPSYSSYEGIGGSFATGLSNFIEMIISLLGGLRR